jgi:hypothetical protein
MYFRVVPCSDLKTIPPFPSVQGTHFFLLLTIYSQRPFFSFTSINKFLLGVIGMFIIFCAKRVCDTKVFFSSHADICKISCTRSINLDSECRRSILDVFWVIRTQHRIYKHFRTELSKAFCHIVHISTFLSVF